MNGIETGTHGIGNFVAYNTRTLVAPVPTMLYAFVATILSCALNSPIISLPDIAGTGLCIIGMLMAARSIVLILWPDTVDLVRLTAVLSFVALVASILAMAMTSTPQEQASSFVVESLLVMCGYLAVGLSCIGFRR